MSQVVLMEKGKSIASDILVPLKRAGIELAAARRLADLPGLAAQVETVAVVIDLDMPLDLGFRASLALDADPDVARVPRIFVHSGASRACRARLGGVRGAAFVDRGAIPGDLVSLAKRAAFDSPALVRA